MAMDMLNLPRNIKGRICSNLDVDSLQQLREVSIAAKQKVDIYFSNMQKLDVRFIELIESGEKSKTTISLACNRNRRHFLAWKIEFLAILKDVETESFEVSTRHCFLSSTMKFELASRFLERLKPVVRRSVIHDLRIFHSDAQQLRVISNFMEGTNIFELRIGYNTTSCADYNSYLDIFKKITPVRVACEIKSLTKDTFAALLGLADLVKTMIVHMNTTVLPNINAVFEEIITRKCERFILIGTDFEVSNFDTERFLQFVHHVDKTVHITLWNESASMDVQVGNARVKKGRRIDMMHKDF